MPIIDTVCTESPTTSYRTREKHSRRHSSSLATNGAGTCIPGRTTATFRSFEPESGVPSQICSCRSCRYNPRSDRNSRPSWHRNLTNPWWSMTPLTFAAHLIVQGGSTILISLAHMHSESPAFPEDNRFELAEWRCPADWWSSA